MACPVNHPLFQALVFLFGVIVVLSRYVRASPIPHAGGYGTWELRGLGEIRSDGRALPWNST